METATLRRAQPRRPRTLARRVRRAASWRTSDDLKARRQLRRMLLRGNAFEFLIGIATVVSVPLVILAPGGIGRSAVGHMTGGLAPLWLTLFGLGGALMAIGLIKLSPRVEVVGLLFFMASMITDTVAVLLYTGGGGAAGAMTFLAVAVASMWRVYVVLELVMAAARGMGEHAR